MDLTLTHPSGNPLLDPTLHDGTKTSHQTVVTACDKPLIYVTLVLVAFGLMSVFTASAHQALSETGNSLAILQKQIAAAILGFGLMVVFSRISFNLWRKLAVPIAFFAIALLTVTMVFGKTVNGSERWISLPFGFQLQPSDIAKLAAIILMAQATSRKRLFTATLFINLMLVGVIFLLVYQQPNLSVSLIIGGMSVLMLFVGGLPITIFVMTLPVMCYFLFHKIRGTEYQWRRITGWLNPWGDPLDSGYNLIQSYFAIGSGGLFGVGLGRSIQKLYYLPFQHTDFIFAVVCEELGLFGALIVIALFGALAWRGFSIAFNCPSHFGQMLAFGITSVILLQALINISVTIGLMPVTGVTLPFISYGGTSMVVSLIMVGVLLNISRYRLNTQMVPS